MILSKQNKKAKNSLKKGKKKKAPAKLQINKSWFYRGS